MHAFHYYSQLEWGFLCFFSPPFPDCPYSYEWVNMRIVSHLGPMSSKVHHPNGKVLPVKASGGLGFVRRSCRSDCLKPDMLMVSDTMYISLYIIIYIIIYLYIHIKVIQVCVCNFTLLDIFHPICFLVPHA